MKPKSLELPHSLCAHFIQWLLNGGHIGKIRKASVDLKKGGNVAKIYCDGKVHPSYKMNEYCISRYELFLKQWFKYGVKFLNELNTCANSVIQINIQKAHNANYLKFAA